VCTAQSREALCVLHSLERHGLCFVESRDLRVFTVQTRGSLHMYFTV